MKLKEIPNTVVNVKTQKKKSRLKVETSQVGRITKTLTKGDRKIVMVIGTDDLEKTIDILTYGGEDFTFSNNLTKETLDKWEGVIKLISKAIEIARGEI